MTASNTPDPKPNTDARRTGQVAFDDPTQNVLDLVKAAIERQDDLRQAESKRLDQLREQSESCVKDLTAADGRRVDEISALRAAHSRELNAAETKRIDAIRAVDVAAVAIATERATAAATVLANQVRQSAETLRALVATTAAASAQQSTASFNQLSDRITLLERTSYEGSGKSAVADPMMTRMMATLDQMQLNLVAVQSKSSTVTEGRTNLRLDIGMLVGIGGVIIAIISTVIGFK